MTGLAPLAVEYDANKILTVKYHHDGGGWTGMRRKGDEGTTKVL